MSKHDMAQFVARSSDRGLEETDMAKVLRKGFPISPQGPWLAGGAVRRTLLNEDVKSDFDFFFRDESQLASFTSSIDAMGLTKLRESEHHIHYKGKLPDETAERDIQCIKFQYYNSAEAVIDSFDFTICQFAFDGESLVTGDHSLWDLGRKRLAVHKITYPVASVRRMMKYGNQGFYVCPGAITALLRQTAESPENMARLGVLYID